MWSGWAGASPAAQRPTLAILKQLFPQRKISPKQHKQFRSIRIDLNGDNRKELIVVEDPNPPRKKVNKKKRCLCKAPKASGKEKAILRAMGSEMRNAIYRVQLIAVKRRRRVRHRILKVWWKPDQAEPSDPKLWLWASCQKLGKKYRSWRRWRIKEVNFSRTDNGLTSSIRWSRCRRLSRYSKRRALRRMRRWVQNGAPSMLKTCPCPKKKNLAYLKKAKPLRVTVAMLPAPPLKPRVVKTKKSKKKAKPSPRKGNDDLKIPSLNTSKTNTESTSKKKGYRIIGRYQASNVQITPLTKDSKIYALRLERVRQVSREFVRETVESLYVLDEGNSKQMIKVFSLRTARDNDPADPESRQWVDLKFRNMDGDHWLEIVANIYYENTNFTGMVSRKMFKWSEGKYVPLNAYRGIYRIRTSSTWSNVPPGVPRRFRKMLGMRVAASNVVDGFRNSVWVGKKKRRSIGDWIRIDWVRRMPVLGVAILTRPVHGLNPVVRSLWRRRKPPQMKPAQFVQIATGTKWKTTATLPASGGIRLVRFPKPVTTQFLKFTIAGQFTNPKTRRRQTLTISNKERSRGFIAEIIPILAQIRYSASSFSRKLGEQKLPRHAGDRRKTTAWAEGRSDHGIGEWLQMVLPLPQTLHNLTVVNGCRRLGEKYILNNRVKAATLTFSDGSTQDVVLKDSHKPQVVKIRPVRTRSVRLTIRTVYRGKLGHTTCITELRP